MWRVLAGVFLTGHGWIHASWLAPPQNDDPRWAFYIDRSWISAIGVPVRAVRALGTALVVTVTIGFTLTAIGLFLDAGWWPALAAASAVASMAHLLLYFRWWLSFGLLIDVGVLLYVLKFPS